MDCRRVVTIASLLMLSTSYVACTEESNLAPFRTGSSGPVDPGTLSGVWSITEDADRSSCGTSDQTLNYEQRMVRTGTDEIEVTTYPTPPHVVDGTSSGVLQDGQTAFIGEVFPGSVIIRFEHVE